ncbi:MAG: hypothetical protein H7A49_09680 [Akkermansiaceae bacterium]|nr:hypothetical protein [Akkermansiaceae bacterium]MCP5544163.1 hypothetical protein [Akkermansiaceae bacterium]
MKPRLSLALFLGSILPAAAQTDVVKADNTTSMVNGGSWVGGVAPTTIDTAVFNDVFTQTGNFGTGSPPPSWLGFRVEGSTVTSLVSVNNTTYANYVETGTGGIDMSASPRDFKVVGFNVNGNQTWNIASGRTLTLGGTRFSGTGDVDITGSGTVVINNNGSPEVYSGTLSVSGGTLDLNALAGGDVVVNTGGTLDSTVALPGNLTVNGGSATQTEAVSGDLVVGDGASFAGDVIVGNATIGASTGAILTIDPLSTEALDALDLTLNGTNTVALGSLPSSPGICDVALYSGTLTGGVANLQLDPAAAAGFRNAPVFDDTDLGAITLEFRLFVVSA